MTMHKIIQRAALIILAAFIFPAAVQAGEIDLNTVVNALGGAAGGQQPMASVDIMPPGSGQMIAVRPAPGVNLLPPGQNGFVQQGLQQGLLGAMQGSVQGRAGAQVPLTQIPGSWQAQNNQAIEDLKARQAAASANAAYQSGNYNAYIAESQQRIQAERAAAAAGTQYVPGYARGMTVNAQGQTIQRRGPAAGYPANIAPAAGDAANPYAPDPRPVSPYALFNNGQTDMIQQFHRNGMEWNPNSGNWEQPR